MQKELANCPFCRITNCTPVYRAENIVMCNQCSTTYLQMRPTSAELYKHYQTYADDHSHMRLPKTIEEIRTTPLRRPYIMELIKKHIQTRGAILDIGCGWGPFLVHAREVGFRPCVGVELTEKARKFALEVLGITFAHTLQRWPEPFDVVVMNHALEHMPNPKEVLHWIFEHLRPGGVFVGCLPNIASLPSRMMGNKWEWVDPDMHYVHYNPMTLGKALTNANFTIELIYTWVGDAGSGQMFATAEALWGAALTSARPELNPEFLGPEMVFVAKKPHG